MNILKNLLKLPSAMPRFATYGARAFAACAPALWNEVPAPATRHSNIEQFKSELKTHLFRQYLTY